MGDDPQNSKGTETLPPFFVLRLEKRPRSRLLKAPLTPKPRLPARSWHSPQSAPAAFEGPARRESGTAPAAVDAGPVRLGMRPASGKPCGAAASVVGGDAGSS